MKRLSFKLATLMLVAGALAPSLLFGQQNKSIEFSGSHMRAALDVQEGKTQIQLCGLTVGEQYSVIAVGAVFGQQAKFELHPAAFKMQTTVQTERPNRILFTATETCADLQLTAMSMQALTSIPLSLSVKCINCPEDKTWISKFTDQVEAANLSTTGNVNPQSLIRSTLIGGGCFDVANVTALGDGRSRGTFASGSSSIGLENGIVLCTGNVNVLPGPNTSGGGGNTGFNTSSFDPDLATLTSGDQYDLSKIEFDFTPTASKVQFDFVFGSEEHCEFVNSQYNDVFGFFISGPGITGNQNIALLPGSNIPVTANNVNYSTNSAFYINNNNALFSPCFFSSTANLADCELDGWTTVFTAVADVIPCETYHIKLAIADVGDAEWSSAVFLRANSFDAGSSAVAEAVYASGQSEALEGCGTSFIRFTRDNIDDSVPLTINFTVSGASTATPGDDYAPLSSPVVIPVGQDEVLVPLQVFQDNLAEGQEDIILLLDEACSCEQTEVTVLINDKATLEVSLDDQLICEGNSEVLAPTITGGVPPFNYQWNTGETTATITVSGPGQFELAVTDACLETQVDSATVDVLPRVQVNEQLDFCAGGAVLFNDSVYTEPTTIIEILPGFGGSCDTVRTIILTEIPLSVLSDTIIFCAGDSIQIGGEVYTMSGTVLDTLPGLNGACDTIITYTLQMLPQPTRSETISFCPGETVTIGGVAYGNPGTVLDTQPGLNGMCDTLVTYTLEYATPAPSTVAIHCPIDYEVPLNGIDPPIVQFDLPTYDSDCPCPGIALELASGLAPGNVFPVGITEVCYVATDSCGNTASCCFDVRISEPEPCDTKAIGCMRYDLLSINKNTADEKTYRIRVTNNCSQDLIYVAIGIPDGLKAVKPADNSLYLSPAGINYAVRNPNYSPFYSIRFSSKLNGGGIKNGQSDVFQYTLPPQVSPDYIHVTAKLTYQSYYEAYLNTFFCPVGIEPDFDAGTVERISVVPEPVSNILVYPNPTSGLLSLNWHNWEAEAVHGRVLNSRGQLVWEQDLSSPAKVQEVQLPASLAEGLYFLELSAVTGERALARFVLRTD